MLALLLSGCWNRTEVEDTVFLASVGVDKAENEYLWTFRVTETEKLTMGMLTSTTAQPGQLASGVITVRAVSLQQAVQLLQPGIMRIISMEHVRWIAFGEELARDGISPVLSQFLRHHQIRRGASVYVVRGPAFKPFLNNKPVADMNPMKFFEGARLVQKRYHLAPPTQLHHLYARLASPGIDAFTAVVGVNEISKQPPGSELPAMGSRTLKAGETPRNGGNNVEFAGTAVFRGDKLAGILTVDETSALLALRGEMGKVYASVRAPEKRGTYLTFRLHQENKPEFRAFFRGNKPVVHAKLQFEVELLSAPVETDYSLPENRRRLERYLSERYADRILSDLIKKVYGEWEADPAGFGQLFRTRFPTFDAWLEYDWDSRVKDLQVTVKTDVVIRRFGLLFSGDIEHD